VRAAGAAALLLVAALGGGLAGPAAAAPVQQEISDTITVTGRGLGHGKGLGQWGALGYATGRSGGPWDHRTILAHYYGNTEVGSIGNPLVAVTLLGQRDQPLRVERSAGVAVEGLEGTAVAVRAVMRPDGGYDVSTGAGCNAGTWTEPTVLPSPVRLRAPGTTGAADDVLRVCNADGSSTGYRGELAAMSRTFDGKDVGVAQTVNVVRLDDLLRSVLPGQLPVSWSDLDGGRGHQAMLAQAVASRGFLGYGDGRWNDLHGGFGAVVSTCDTVRCLRYAGVGIEDLRTDDAVRSTSGEVRVRDGAVVRTDFHSSSGGWTAEETFPAVRDVGDDMEGHSHARWTDLLDRRQVEARYGLGQLQAIEILQRNGFGDDGGRVTAMRLVGTIDTVELSGAEFRSHWSLPSDWFQITGVPPRAPVEPREIADACPEPEVPRDVFADVDPANVHALAIDCVTWWDVAQGRTARSFAPSSTVTRGQMASFVHRLVLAAGGAVPDDPVDRFRDDDGTEHEAAINALAAIDVVRGKTATTYAPQEPVERAQTASLVSRALLHLGFEPGGAVVDAFADDEGSVHESAANLLASEGILTGKGPGRLAPLDPTRRDQMASLLARTLDLLIDDGTIAGAG
jgi:SpoIID/LytB domain protein